MNRIMNLIEAEIGLPPEIQFQLIKTFVIILVMALLFQGVKNILYKAITDSKTYYRTRKVIAYIFIFISFILVGRIWFQGIQSMTTFLGLFSAGLAIAMKDLVMNIAGWGYILWKGLFRIGDRIEIGDISGDVMDIQLFDFTLMETRNWVNADQSTGRIVHIPNSTIFTKALFNYNIGLPYVWDEIPIHVTHESNWAKAKGILEEIANEYWAPISKEARKTIKEASKEYMIFNNNPHPTVYTSINNENSITLTIRYMCAYKERRNSSEKIYEEVLERFANHTDIEFAYPTQRLYDRPREKGKGEE